MTSTDSHAIMHDRTELQIAQFAAHPSHAVLLSGPNGIGKSHLARILAADLLNVTPGALQHYPYLKMVVAERSTISIEMIRDLQHFLQLKTAGSQTIRRVAIIEHGDGLTVEAQNAVLKVLEEPPADTVLIVTATTPRALLPTIVSRLQVITVFQPGSSALKDFFHTGDGGDADIDRTYFLSGGLPGLMEALIHDDREHPLVSGVAQAKALLVLPVHDRLAQVDSLNKQKEATTYMIEALLHIARTAIEQASQHKDVKRLKRWHLVFKEAYAAQLALSANANAKLVLANLMLRI
jgi:hypothetical protein